MPDMTVFMEFDVKALGRERDGFYLLQKDEEQVLIEVSDGKIESLGATLTELVAEGYKATPMAVMPVYEYNLRLETEYTRGYNLALSKKK